MNIQLVNDPIDVASATADVTAPDCGAVVTFLGVVRNNHHGREVLRLEYTAYEPMALHQMQLIAATIEERWSVRHVSILHRLGTLEVGEASVLIALALPHRADGFDALRYAIDTFKQTVPIWKKEFFADGKVVWVEGS